MTIKLLRYEVRKESIPLAADAARAFVDEVRRKEGGTARYDAYQEKDSGRFVHIMQFRVASAEQYHAKTAWHKRFHETIAPMCTSPPQTVEISALE
jgi:quinol monooxygenase YgiN